MDLPSKAILDVLTFLLPGFVAAQLLYSLTPALRPIPFERVIQALIFTVLIQAAVSVVETSLVGVGNRMGAIGPWTDGVRLGWSFFIAVLFAIVFARFDNRDTVHSFLRRFGVTHQTSFPSEWFSALSQSAGYVVLHLTGQRRLYGWPEEWPNHPDSGHFVIAEAEWLVDKERLPLEGVRRILIRAQDVEMIELMEVVLTPDSAEVEVRGRS